MTFKQSGLESMFNVNDNVNYKDSNTIKFQFANYGPFSFCVHPNSSKNLYKVWGPIASIALEFSKRNNIT